ncbi:hypothetical protein DE146DRAFT_733739 [Phaeosphaeria sp. MPI-PUGE-AT-0046c]|nr:hypothetical protein DE146DRAFT_733739 [Phaeosphaeria sp. MPI-PUGE-AT-0046c]
MSQNPPQTLSVKRKRNEAPVDALIIEQRFLKKQKSQNLDARPKAQPSSGHFYRRLTKPNDAPQQSLVPPTPTAERRFYLDALARTQNKRVFVEERATPQTQDAATGGELHAHVKEPVSEESSRPQKRPGAGTAYHPTQKAQVQQQARTPEPSDHDVRQLEALSHQVEKEDNLLIPLPSPSKHKPKAPAQRFAQRHPEKAAALAAQETPQDSDAMDIDGDEYVYDTYIREPILPDADGKLPAPSGTVGTLVIAEEDEDWWNGEDESDKEFDTDDEDENAEDYYANDYPEDELDEDDEYGRDLYQRKYRHGSDDEEFNAGSEEEGVRSEGDEDDVHFRMTVPKVQRAGYWGAVGEA